MKSVHQNYKIAAPLEVVWRAFVDQQIIEKWGGGPAVMSDREGFEFSLWDGSIHGRNTKVKVNKLLQQDWYSGDQWSSPSKVSFVFHEFRGRTTVTLRHTHIPDTDVKDIAEGWKDYYLGPLKEFVEQHHK